MIKNLKIGVRLGIAFALLTLLAVALGLIGIYEARAMNDQWRLIQQDAMAKRGITTRGIGALGDGIHHFKNFILRGEDFNKKFSADMDAVERIAGDYKATGYLSAEEEKLMAKLLEATAAYRHDMDTLVTLGTTSHDRAGLDKAG